MDEKELSKDDLQLTEERWKEKLTPDPSSKAKPATGQGSITSMHDEEYWKNKLSPEQYRVLREKGTEMPGTGTLLHEKREGTYNCVACGNPLFSSDAKFESGTGWPSFDQALPGAIREVEDKSHGMSRVEVVCAHCGSHLGHMFDDGPADTTGKRYCLNSVCLDLDPKNPSSNSKNQPV